MINETTSLSRYDRRVILVQDVLAENTKLEDAVARSLAKKVLRAIDSIPETIR